MADWIQCGSMVLWELNLLTPLINSLKHLIPINLKPHFLQCQFHSITLSPDRFTLAARMKEHPACLMSGAITQMTPALLKDLVTTMAMFDTENWVVVRKHRL